jgi:CubicO group peptidase (beta-lactamase class C family)
MILLLACLLAQEAAIDEIVSAKIDPKGPGLAVLAIKEGRVLHKKGYGLADLETESPVTPQTLFELASCSKQFTAVAILTLLEEKKLAIDDDVRKWLPELKAHDAKRPIRISDLVHHTSGLPDYLGLLMHARRIDAIDNREALRLVKDRDLEFPTGTKWRYSNTNYCLLALIVERISKKSFGSFLKSGIFRTAAMKTGDVLEPGSTPKNRAWGYEKRGPDFVKSAGGPLTTGDGGIFLSLDDWAAYEKSLGSVLRKETWDLAYRPGALDDGESHGYGFGLLIRKSGASTIIGHQGEWAGFRSHFIRSVETGTTLVLMANRTDLDLGELSDSIFERISR